jgi:hypothetical protein
MATGGCSARATTSPEADAVARGRGRPYFLIMSGMSGAYRDASAALERVTKLEEENAALRQELTELGGLRIQLSEVDALRREVESLRAIARGENEDAYVKRVTEERDELTYQLRELRTKLAAKETEVAKLRLRLGSRNALDRLFEAFSLKE